MVINIFFFFIFFKDKPEVKPNGIDKPEKVNAEYFYFMNFLKYIFVYLLKIIRDLKICSKNLKFVLAFLFQFCFISYMSNYYNSITE